MQESLRQSPTKLPQPQPRISDMLQNIYTEQAYTLRNENQLRKRLYSQLIQKSQERLNEKKSLEKHLNKQQNQHIDLFWKNEQERRRQMSRKRRRQIQQARKVNNNQHHKQLNKSMCEQQYYLQKSFKDDLNDFIGMQQKKKQQKQRYYRQGMILQGARQERKQFDRSIQKLIQYKKYGEQQELQARRDDYYRQWRQKHLQDNHPQTYKLFDQLQARKQAQKQRLEQLISVKGGAQLNQRVAIQRLAQLEQVTAKKQQHVRQLKQQVQENTYKAAIDKYLQLNYQRNKMNQMGKALAQRDQFERQQKKEMHSQHLNTLRGQMKQRNLLPQADKIEFAGIGSPAHIGKIVHDDRLKQLKWIQRSFLQEMRQI